MGLNDNILIEYQPQQRISVETKATSANILSSDNRDSNPYSTG
jgi:hypothetical protein